MLDQINDTNLYTVIAVIFYLLAFRNIWFIIAEKMNAPAAITWILVNISFPMIGVPLYFFLGQSKLKSYGKRMRRKVTSRHNPIVSEPSKNKIKVICSGQEAFAEIFSTIESADTFILVQYYIFRTDSLGLKLIDLLIKKARTGVQVFFLYDNLGSFGLIGKHGHRMKQAGIHVVRFLPFTLQFNLQINFRNHRKVILVDGSTCFLGGMNVGEEYLSKNKHWRDTQLKIQGPACEAIMETFFDDWSFASTDKERQVLEPLMKVIPTETEGDCKLRVFSFGPGDQWDTGLLMFMDAIQSARKSITIATPYFIPDLILERCLDLCLVKNIEVNLIVPAQSDSYSVQLINQHYIKKIARKGANVYLYADGFMHQKVLLIDESKAIIGTSNFDNRSIYLNFETSILIEDSSVAKEVKTMLDEDLKKCRPLKDAESGTWNNFLGNIIRLASPIF